MMRDFFVLAVVLVAFSGLALWGAVSIDGYSCRTKADAMVVPHTYGMVQGCMVKWKGQWMPLEQVRAL